MAIESPQRYKTEPVLMAVLANKMEFITKEMTNTLLRTGRSGLLNMAKDFSCSIVTADNRLIASSMSLPAHVTGIELVSKNIMELCEGDIKEGDAFLHNSPYHGSSHAADHILAVPVFYKGNHMFTALAKAHMADVGNSLPTTYMASAKDVYEEGALIFPAVRIQRNYQDVKDIIRMCRVRIRVPDCWYGDYLAQLGAARIAERRLKEMLEKYGADVIENFVGDWLNYSESQMIDEIKKLPKGTWYGETKHDPWPKIPEGVPIKVKVSVDPDEAYIYVDLTDNIDCIEAGLNQTEFTAKANAMIGVFFSVDPKIPHNDGAYRRIKILLRENCVAGIPRFPHCCSVATTNLGDRIVNVVQTTFAKMSRHFGMAEGGVGTHAACAVVSGKDWRSGGKPYVNQLHMAFNGGPGGPGVDGWLNYCLPVGAGMLFRNSIEVAELKQPFQVDQVSIVRDSEGAGQWRGAPAQKVVFGPKRDPLTIIFPEDGIENPPQGVRGGMPAFPAKNYKINHKGKKIRQLTSMTEDGCQPGEKVVSITCGGGGYGNPFDRDPDAVKLDVREGWISLKRAKEVYGVVLNTKVEEYQVEWRATDELRKQLRIGRGEHRR